MICMVAYSKETIALRAWHHPSIKQSCTSSDVPGAETASASQICAAPSIRGSWYCHRMGHSDSARAVVYWVSLSWFSVWMCWCWGLASPGSAHPSAASFLLHALMQGLPASLELGPGPQAGSCLVASWCQVSGWQRQDGHHQRGAHCLPKAGHGRTRQPVLVGLDPPPAPPARLLLLGPMAS